MFEAWKVSSGNPMIESESDGSPVDIVGEESVQDWEEKGSSFARA